MQIDLRNEKLLSLTDAARAVPAIDGRRPHTSTIWRWCRRGIRGIRLEYLRLGHRVVTSEAAIGRFAQRLAEADTPPMSAAPTQPPKKRTPRRRERDIQKAEATLAQAGI